MTLTLSDLRQFTGTETETCWRHRLFPRFTYTDGVRYLAQEAGAYWLIEAIFSHQSNRLVRQHPMLQDFQRWTLKVNNQRGLLACGDGNGWQVLTQHLPDCASATSSSILPLALPPACNQAMVSGLRVVLKRSLPWQRLRGSRLARDLGFIFLGMSFQEMRMT